MGILVFLIVWTEYIYLFTILKKNFLSNKNLYNGHKKEVVYLIEINNIFGHLLSLDCCGIWENWSIYFDFIESWFKKIVCKHKLFKHTLYQIEIFYTNQVNLTIIIFVIHFFGIDGDILGCFTYTLPAKNIIRSEKKSTISMISQTYISHNNNAEKLLKNCRKH